MGNLSNSRIENLKQTILLSKLMNKMNDLPLPLMYLTKAFLLSGDIETIKAIENLLNIEGNVEIPSTSTDFLVTIEWVKQLLNPYLPADDKELPYNVIGVNTDVKGVDGITYNIVIIMINNQLPTFVPIVRDVPFNDPTLILERLTTINDAVMATARAVFTMPPTFLPLYLLQPKNTFLNTLVLFRYASAILSMLLINTQKIREIFADVMIPPEDTNANEIRVALMGFIRRIVDLIDDDNTVKQLLVKDSNDDNVRKLKAALSIMGLLAVNPNESIGMLTEVEKKLNESEAEELDFEKEITNIALDRIKKYLSVDIEDIRNTYIIAKELPTAAPMGRTTTEGLEATTRGGARTGGRTVVVTGLGGGLLGGLLGPTTLPPRRERRDVFGERGDFTARRRTEGEVRDNDPWGEFLRRRRGTDRDRDPFQ